MSSSHNHIAYCQWRLSFRLGTISRSPDILFRQTIFEKDGKGITQSLQDAMGALAYSMRNMALGLANGKASLHEQFLGKFSSFLLFCRYSAAGFNVWVAIL